MNWTLVLAAVAVEIWQLLLGLSELLVVLLLVGKDCFDLVWVCSPHFYLCHMAS